MKILRLYVDSRGSRHVPSHSTKICSRKLQVTEAKGPVDNATNGAMGTFDKPLNHSIHKVVEELGSPVPQGAHKPPAHSKWR